MEGLLSTGPTPSSLVTTCNKPSPSIWSCFMSYASTSRFHDWLVSFSTHSSACYCVKSSSILNKIAPNIGPSKGAWILFWTTFQYVWIEPNLMVECVASYQMDRLFDCIIKPATGIFVLFVWKWKNKNTQQYNLHTYWVCMYVRLRVSPWILKHCGQILCSSYSNTKRLGFFSLFLFIVHNLDMFDDFVHCLYLF